MGTATPTTAKAGASRRRPADRPRARIAQTASGSTTRCVLDVQRGLPAVIGAKAGPDVTHYMHGPLGPFAQRNPDAWWDWMLHDGLGSVRGVFDGTLQNAAEYDPFGEPIVALAGTAYGFTGELTDGNGLVYLRARYLVPGLGTFASRDPWRGSASAPRTWNGYAWVEGNVVNRVDPGGMASCFSSGDGLLMSQMTQIAQALAARSTLDVADTS
ncbi:MAG: RHS repeat-associated core domain-containing protein [Chloroflexi bacterium]|nr:RHS repeat-associated core domain-containing protein [Chloroflexota bacterium]